MSRAAALVSLMDRFGGSSPAPADRPRRRLLVGLALLSVPIGLLWGVFYAAFNEPLAAVFPSLHAVFAILGLAVFQRRPSEDRLRDQLLAQFLLLPFVLMLSLGTFAASSVVVVWSFLAPAGALVFDTPRRALGWFGGYALVLAIGYAAGPWLREDNNLPDALVHALFVLNIGTLSVVSFAILALFALQREAALGLAERERGRSDDLLRNILPAAVAERLKGDSRRIAEQFDVATILFADVVGFTPMSARLTASETVDILDRLFTTFDGLVDRAGLEKIKTIGDAYMVAGGVPSPRPDHAVAIAGLALEMQAAVAGLSDPPLELRIGINSGPVVAGVIGRRRLIYDLWGDTVNVASRMESHGIPGRIQLTRATYELIRDAYTCEPRGTVDVKGRGPVEAWFLVGARPDAGAPAGDAVRPETIADHPAATLTPAPQPAG